VGDPTSDFLALTLDFTGCPWLKFAAGEAEAKVEEDTGRGRSNPRIDQYLATVGLSDDATPWCSAFVNWCMRQAGIAGTGRGLARSWLHWGVPIADCRLGAVAVFRRGSNPAFGHVAFYVGDQSSKLLVLGGNQGNAVNVKPYDRDRLLGLRWPA
jgi:uncharacterized protein (TIGR02594 family)